MKCEPKTCPDCGAPIPANAPQGLCPKCLMSGAAAPTEAGSAVDTRPRLSAPPVAEIAAAFPQLQVAELIGQGGMGFVYRARQPKLERDVALKILPQHLAEDPRFAERFAREGKLLARLNHPNIVSVYDFGEAGGFFYLLMEYVDGVNLRQAMRTSRFIPAQALAVVPAICEALQFAHDEGVLHRDIKPENILLDAKGRVKIADFGIAKLMTDGRATFLSPKTKTDGDLEPQLNPPEPATGLSPPPSLTAVESALGTPQYMAPEQIEHPSDVDHRADIYSLGVVFYELLTGELPIGKFAPPSTKTLLDERVDEIVLRALKKERELRQQSARELKTEVETVTSEPGGPSGSRHQTRKSDEPGNLESPIKSARDQPSARLALGLFLAAVLGTPLLMTISSRHEMALIFGDLALISAVVFGLIGWRLRYGKAVVIATLALVGGIGIIFAVTMVIWTSSRKEAAEARRIEAVHEENAVRNALAARAAAQAQPTEDVPPADPQPLLSLFAVPPVVVETQPRSGARDVAPGVTEIRVRFSKEMTDQSWSWSSASSDSTPQALNEPHYDPANRTCSMTVKLEPNKTYAYWLNSENFNNFQDTDGRPAVPYLLIFHTQAASTSQ